MKNSPIHILSCFRYVKDTNCRFPPNLHITEKLSQALMPGLYKDYSLIPAIQLLCDFATRCVFYIKSTLNKWRSPIHSIYFIANILSYNLFLSINDEYPLCRDVNTTTEKIVYCAVGMLFFDYIFNCCINRILYAVCKVAGL